MICLYVNMRHIVSCTTFAIRSLLNQTFTDSDTPTAQPSVPSVAEVGEELEASAFRAVHCYGYMAMGLSPKITVQMMRHGSGRHL